MKTTLTIRITVEQRKRLKEVAGQREQSESEFVRQLIEREFEMIPLGQRLEQLKGRLPASPEPSDAFARQIRERNWRK